MEGPGLPKHHLRKAFRKQKVEGLRNSSAYPEKAGRGGIRVFSCCATRSREIRTKESLLYNTKKPKELL